VEFIFVKQKEKREKTQITYSVFHRFGQAKFAYGDLILSSSQFSLLPQRPLKMTHAVKVVKIDLKIIISLP